MFLKLKVTIKLKSSGREPGKELVAMETELFYSGSKILMSPVAILSQTSHEATWSIVSFLFVWFDRPGESSPEKDCCW